MSSRMLNPEEKKDLRQYRPGQENETDGSEDGLPVIKTVKPFKMYIRNVGVEMTEDAIRNIFEKYGRVYNIYLSKFKGLKIRFTSCNSPPN